MPSDRIEAEIAYLKTALKITPEQAGQWNALADVLRSMAKHRDAKILDMRAHLEGRPPDPISALERRQLGLAEEARDVSDLIAAAKPLYANLNDDQKKASVELLGPPPDLGLPPPPPIGLPLPD
jgi:hypothetical protein